MNSSQMMEEDGGSKDPNLASANQPADSPGDMVETESIHERHEYEDAEETALTHDRGTRSRVCHLFFRMVTRKSNVIDIDLDE